MPHTCRNCLRLPDTNLRTGNSLRKMLASYLGEKKTLLALTTCLGALLSGQFLWKNRCKNQSPTLCIWSRLPSPAVQWQDSLSASTSRACIPGYLMASQICCLASTTPGPCVLYPLPFRLLPLKEESGPYEKPKKNRKTNHKRSASGQDWMTTKVP